MSRYVGIVVLLFMGVTLAGLLWLQPPGGWCVSEVRVFVPFTRAYLYADPCTGIDPGPLW